MIRKKQILALLVVLNVVLFVALLVGANQGRSALAQQGMSTTNYLAVTAEIQNDYDALFVLDLQQRRLNVLVPRLGGNPVLELQASRDLKSDFRVKVQP